MVTKTCSSGRENGRGDERYVGGAGVENGVDGYCDEGYGVDDVLGLKGAGVLAMKPGPVGADGPV